MGPRFPAYGSISYVCICVNVNTLHTTYFCIFYYLWFCISFCKMYICTWGDAQTPSNFSITAVWCLYTYPWTCAHGGERQEIWMTFYSSCMREFFHFCIHFQPAVEIMAWQSGMRQMEGDKTIHKKVLQRIAFHRSMLMLVFFSTSNWCIANSTSSINLIECLFQRQKRDIEGEGGNDAYKYKHIKQPTATTKKKINSSCAQFPCQIKCYEWNPNTANRIHYSHSQCLCTSENISR